MFPVYLHILVKSKYVISEWIEELDANNWQSLLPYNPSDLRALLTSSHCLLIIHAEPQTQLLHLHGF